MRASAGTLTAIASSTQFKAAGFLLMALISLLSATASVYTEYVMNRSSYRHESLNLQNMRLYSIGMALNAAYYWQQSDGQLHGFLSDIRGPHWAVVLVLALMGLITGVLIKHYGTIVKVYASSVASLFAAWVSQVLLKDPPPALFYAGVCMAMAATIQLQRTRTASDNTSESPRLKTVCEGSARKQQLLHNKLPTSLVVPIGLAILVLVFVLTLSAGHQQGSGTPGDGPAVLNRTLPQLPPNLNNPASLVPRRDNVVDAPMPALPPFEPTCLLGLKDRTQLGCRRMNCSLAQSCTQQDPACCAYYNLRMLQDLDNLLQAKGLQGQYALVFGSALGAARNQSMLGHTEDVDVAFSPTALQVLARNSTREQLWRQGYVLWHDHHGQLWRMCPHELHPLPEFRATMAAQDGNHVGAYLDGYLMWPLPRGASSCADEALSSEEDALAAVAMEPLAAQASTSAAAGDDSIDSQFEPAKDRVFCLQVSTLPLIIRAGERSASIGGSAFPAPHNLQEHLVTNYGPNWRVPNTTYHGASNPWPPDYRHINHALYSRLFETAWDTGLPWEERWRRCRVRRRGAAATATAAAGQDGAESEELIDAGSHADSDWEQQS